MTTMPGPLGPTGTLSLKYDPWNRLVEITQNTTYEYDGLGQRIVRVEQSPDVTHDYYYYYNDQWQLLTEVKDGDVEAVYQWHPFYVDALAVRMRASDIHYFLHDANYNVTAAIDDSTDTVVERYAYTPYGEVTVLDANFSADTDQISDIGNTHLYTGRERDPETGLQLNRRRFYASHLGRWLTRDRIGYYGSKWNLYEYVESIPMIDTDPFGEQIYFPPSPCKQALDYYTHITIVCLLRIGADAGDAALPNYPSMPFQHCVWNCRMTRDNGPEFAERKSAIKEECDVKKCNAMKAVVKACSGGRRAYGAELAGICCSAEQPSDYADNQTGRDCGECYPDAPDDDMGGICENCCMHSGLMPDTPDGPGTTRPCGRHMPPCANEY